MTTPSTIECGDCSRAFNKDEPKVTVWNAGENGHVYIRFVCEPCFDAGVQAGKYSVITPTTAEENEL
jgi:hypothetical protein